MTLNVEETTNIVDTWFENQHEKIIAKLSNNKPIQLKYLKRIIHDKEGVITKLMNEPSPSQQVNDDYNKYKSLLELHVELLCELEPKSVLPTVKKEYYPVNECTAICDKSGNFEGKAYLLKRAGDYSLSLRVYLEILRRIGGTLLSSKEQSLFEENVMRFYTQFAYALEVCLENARVTSSDPEGEKLWFGLLDFLYEMMMKVFGIEEKNEMWDKLNDVIKNWIKEVLSKMMDFVRFPVIMRQLTERHGELEIESFKEMFASMLSSYFYNEKVLEAATLITSNELSAQSKALSSLHSQGFPVLSTVCAKCSVPVDSNQHKIVVFPCGHIYHDACYDKECYFCVYKDISKFGRMVEAMSLERLMRKEEKKQEIKIRKVQEKQKEEAKAEAKEKKDVYSMRMRRFERTRVKSYSVLHATFVDC